MEKYYCFLRKKIPFKSLTFILSACLYFILNIIPFLFTKKHKNIKYNYKKNKYEEGSLRQLNLKNKINRNVDLSIIIACYNSKEYIEKCIESCLNQITKYSYEIIAINDGSTDNTLELLKKYNNKITIINSSNLKQGHARNLGIEESNGKYISFVDSDDMICKNYVDTIMKNIKDVDILQFGFDNINSFDNVISRNVCKHKSKIIDLNKIHKSFLFNDGLACTKAYSYKLFLDVGFPEFVHYEDSNYEMILLQKARNYFYVNKSIYLYRHHNNQETITQRDKDIGINQYEVIKVLYEYINNFENHNDKLLKYVTMKNLSTILYVRTKFINIDTQYSLFIDISNFINRYFDNNDYKYLNYKNKKLLKAYLEKDFNYYIKVQEKL